MKLKNKVVLMTGCSSGVGYQAALLFAQEGATVYAVARRQERLEELAQAAKDQGTAGKVVPFPADLTEAATIEKLFAAINEAEGQLDILVSNAGVMDNFEPVGEVTDDLWNRLFLLNVTSPMMLMREAVKVMKAGSSIVCTSSTGSIVGGKAGAAYSASKHALNGLVKNTAAMYLEDGIRCNAVAPGGIATEMTQFDPADLSAKGMGVLGKTTPGIEIPMAEAIDVAKCLLFLASDDAKNITGSILVADGGLTNF